MKKYKNSDIIQIGIALFLGSVTIFVEKNIEYRYYISGFFFALALFFVVLPLIRKENPPDSKDKKLKSNNMKELKEQLIAKYTIIDLLDLIQENFKDHFLKKSYTGINPLLLNISTVVLDLVTYCDMNDKLDDLKNLLKK